MWEWGDIVKKGEEYFNKRDGVKGTIKAFDDFTVTMDLENETIQEEQSTKEEIKHDWT